MNNSNIVAAGVMISIAQTVLGIIIFIAALLSLKDFVSFMPNGIVGFSSYLCLTGALTLILCGILLLVMLTKVEKHPVLATPILILGVFVAIAGIGAFAFMPRNPFAWIMVLLCIPMFIDTLCLKINLAGRK